jgi:hypothetical protein
MSFAMTHLAVANKLLRKTNIIKYEADFYLGSIAPDFVHIRKNYNSEMKKRSHLCVGKQRWGRLTNNDAWMKHAMEFLSREANGDNRDFILGYVVHILTDIENNKKIWMPFYKENKAVIEAGAASQYHFESEKVDLEQFDILEDRCDIWDQLLSARAFDVGQVITACEINEMKNVFITERYKNRERYDTAKNKYVTLMTAEKFIESTSELIYKMLFTEVQMSSENMI